MARYPADVVIACDAQIGTGFDGASAPLQLHLLVGILDPVERVNKLPLAIVNEDKGEYRNGAQESLGAALVTKLTSDKKPSGSRQQLPKRIKAWKIIPMQWRCLFLNYFTEQAYSVGTDAPEYTHLRYEINEGANMLARKWFGR